MKLWIDDVRPAPDGWVWAKTSGEALSHIHTGVVREVSFDNDLGPGMLEGWEIANEFLQLVRMDTIPAPAKAKCHSANVAARPRIEATCVDLTG